MKGAKASRIRPMLNLHHITTGNMMETQSTSCQFKCYRRKHAAMSRRTIKRSARPYHHGDLKASLLAEAETILEKEGIQALTLRAMSRAAGVSHTAPRNHFDDLTGVLSELAALGFSRFSAALEMATQRSEDDA